MPTFFVFWPFLFFWSAPMPHDCHVSVCENKKIAWHFIPIIFVQRWCLVCQLLLTFYQACYCFYGGCYGWYCTITETMFSPFMYEENWIQEQHQALKQIQHSSQIVKYVIMWYILWSCDTYWPKEDFFSEN